MWCQERVWGVCLVANVSTFMPRKESSSFIVYNTYDAHLVEHCSIASLHSFVSILQQTATMRYGDVIVHSYVHVKFNQTNRTTPLVKSDTCHRNGNLHLELLHLRWLPEETRRSVLLIDSLLNPCCFLSVISFIGHWQFGTPYPPPPPPTTALQKITFWFSIGYKMRSKISQNTFRLLADFEECIGKGGGVGISNGASSAVGNGSTWKSISFKIKYTNKTWLLTN